MPSRGSIAIKKASLFVSSQSPPDNRDDGDSFASPPSIYHFSIFFEEIERRGEGRGWSGAKPINFPRQRRIKRPILLPRRRGGLASGEKSSGETISRPVPRQAVFNFSSPFSKTDNEDRTPGPPQDSQNSPTHLAWVTSARYLTLEVRISCGRTRGRGARVPNGWMEEAWHHRVTACFVHRFATANIMPVSAGPQRDRRTADPIIQARTLWYTRWCATLAIVREANLRERIMCRLFQLPRIEERRMIDDRCGGG